MPKRKFIDATSAEETENLIKKRRVDQPRDSGGCIAFVLWKLGLFGELDLDTIKMQLNAEIQGVYENFTNTRHKYGRVRSISVFTLSFGLFFDGGYIEYEIYQQFD
jgi:hypothetical protein